MLVHLGAAEQAKLILANTLTNSCITTYRKWLVRFLRVQFWVLNIFCLVKTAVSKFLVHLGVTEQTINTTSISFWRSSGYHVSKQQPAITSCSVTWSSTSSHVCVELIKVFKLCFGLKQLLKETSASLAACCSHACLSAVWWSFSAKVSNVKLSITCDVNLKWRTKSELDLIICFSVWSKRLEEEAEKNKSVVILCFFLLVFSFLSRIWWK